jgi:diguanylate cyclase (GGDEF)-like protein
LVQAVVSTQQVPGEVALVVRALTRRVGAETVLLARDVGGGIPEVVASCGAPYGQEYLATADDGLVRRALALEEPALLTIAPGDASLGMPVSGVRPRYAVAAPVRLPHAWRGVVCAGFAASPPGDRPTTLWIVDSFARMLELCLLDPGTVDGLVEAARRDPAVPSLTYAAAREQLMREVNRASRHSHGVSCCVIDLDGFRRVNDLRGHLHGTRVLGDVAASLRKGMRASDTVGRFGGDEFLAILPQTDERAAIQAAERFRIRVAAATLDSSGESLGASIGVAQWRPGSSAEGTLAAAEEALKAAKRAGGATVVSETEAYPDRPLPEPPA